LGLIVLLLPILGPNINKKTNKKRKYKKFDKILEEKKNINERIYQNA